MSRIRFLGGAAISVLATLVLLPAPAAAAPSSIWTADSWTRVFKTTTKPAGASAAIAWDAARNEAESYQILVRNGSSFTVSAVSFTTLTNGGSTVAASNLSYKFQQYHSPDGGPAQPDPLSNATSIAVPANTTQGIWVTVKVPKAQAAGTYTGTATVNSTAGNFTVPLSLTVYNVQIPDAVNSNYIYSTWNVFHNEYSDSDASVIADEIVQRYGYARYSTPWWNLIRDFAKEQKDARQNQIYVSIDTVLDGPTTFNGTTYTFNWSKFDQFIQTFIDHGSVKRIRGNALLNALTTDKVWIIDNVGGTTKIALTPVNSTKANRWLDQFLPALKAHLDAKGWTSMWYQSISDEPGSQANYIWAADRYRAYFGAQAKTQDAFTTVQSGLIGKESVWIPLIDVLQDNQQFYQNRQAAGDELWTYVCLLPDPGLGWLNRWNTYPAYTARQLSWGNFKYGATGFYHWGYNAWTASGYPNTETWPGDGYIVYPDTANGTVRTSARSIATRDGNEDYELFTILKQVNPSAIAGIIDPIVTNFQWFSDDTDLMVRQRKELILRAAGATLPSRLETENGTRAGSAGTDNAGSGFSGSGYVIHLDQSIGNSVTVSTNVPSRGAHAVDIRYSNGTSTASTMTIFVNGVQSKKVTFPPTGNWNTTWATVTTSLDLSAGVNTIKMQFTNGDGPVDPDYLTVW